MEIRTRFRKLSIATYVATICLVLWLLFLADGSAQMAAGGRRSRLGSDAVPLIATLAPSPDDYEPDDAQHEASQITVNDDSPQRHNFHVADDGDWVKFWAWAGNAYTIRTFDLDFNCDTVLELYDAEGRKLREDDDGSEEPRASRIDDWTPSENGTYYVMVSQYNPSVGGNSWYSLEITDSVTCKDEYEPDDAWDDAKQITVDGTPQYFHKFHGPCGGDEDWVKFEAVIGDVYTIRTFDLVGGNDTALELYWKTYSGDLVKVAENDDDPDNIPASRIDWKAPASRTYFVKVMPFMTSAGGCEFGYSLRVDTLTVTPTPAPTPTPPSIYDPDEYEPDDAMHEAIIITVNGIHQVHSFHAENDKDWVKFWAWAGNRYTFRTFDLEGGNDTTLKLYDAEGRKLGEDDDGGEEPGASRIDWLAPENGAYFVRVARPKVGEGEYYGLDSSDDLTYSLGVNETIPCRDAYESDNTQEEAEWITVGEVQQRNFHVPCSNNYHLPDTADWVKFEATKGFTYTIKTSHLEGGNDTNLGLYDEDGISVTENDDYADDIPASRIVWEAPEDGTYYVEVSPFDHRAGGCDVSYTLEVAPWITSLDLTVSQTEVPADGIESSTLTACVEDLEGEPVEGVTVDFAATLGTLSPPSAPTDSSGCATSYLTSTEPGTAEVKACVGLICDTKLVYFNPPVASVELWADPASIVANGESTSVLTALVKDTEGENMPDEMVTFTTNLGIFVESDGKIYNTMTTDSGTATANLRSSTISGTAAVTATADSKIGAAYVEFTPLKLIYLSLVLKPLPLPTPTPTPTPPPCLPTPTAPTCDWCEPNSDWENRDRCGPLCSGTSYTVYLCCANDPTDYYYIDITTRNLITIALDVPDGVDYDLYLYDSLGELVAKSDEYGEDEYIGYAPPATGRYYIRVHPYQGCSDSDPYILTATHD